MQVLDTQRQGRILLVDDDSAVRLVCSAMLRAAGYEVALAEGGESALAALKDGTFDLVVSDVRMPGMTGLELLRRIDPRISGIDVLLVTGHASVDAAVNAIRLGALDYVVKPFRNGDLLHSVAHALERRRLLEIAPPETGLSGFAGMVGNSPRMRRLFRQIEQVAPRRQAVLITGESGTGKELAARAIHECSPWRSEPFVIMDCGGLAGNLIESELFGHIRGAFTGAVQARSGLLARAGAGTLFIDEVGELSLDLQVKLLRILQEREFRSLGDDRPRQFEARVVAATNVDLEEAVARGNFRKDLYYRLNVYRVELPPLRERRSDITGLFEHLLHRHAAPGERLPALSQGAASAMLRYSWPGNIRELESCALRVLSQGESVVDRSALPREVRGSIDEPGALGYLASVERQAILDMLDAAGGNCARAAGLLGVAKTTVYRKLKEYGIESRDAAAEPQAHEQHCLVENAAR